VFGILPWITAFVFAQFPAGLVMYFAWSNIWSIVQQAIIQRRMGMDPVAEMMGEEDDDSAPTKTAKAAS
ncbi:hypothetical protein, partial [Winogradskyella ouciana]